MHDLAESIVGDITPYCGVSKEEKRQREMDAMQEIAKLIAPRGERLMELFEVYTIFTHFFLFLYILATIILFSSKNISTLLTHRFFKINMQTNHLSI